jgi:stress response protein SCP2|tara:strand:- start:46 stop:1305 length:1260 start_codon:yes stop_codon:yes gene_type:complete
VLQREVDRRLCEFASNPASRTKKRCPSLGEVLPLLCVATPGATPTWTEIARGVISEVMDRGVLWAAKACGGWIANDAKRLVEGAGIDRERLQVTLEANKISFRLIGFHVAFLHEVARPGGAAIGDFAERLDTMYGRPDVVTTGRVAAAIERVFGASTWPAKFAAMRIKCPSPEELTDKLVRAVKRSREKGYHRHGMNFTKVHSSGVSRILMRGETYTAAPNLKRIKFVDTWRWNSSYDHVFLDASVLVFAHDRRSTAGGVVLGLGELLGVVDYQHTTSNARIGRGAITHSGDVMDDAEQRGSHTVEIDLSKLSSSVGTLLFTLSSWAGKTLLDAKQPVTTFVDAEQGVSLCSYALDDRTDGELRAKSAAHMCALRRGVGGKSTHGGGWRVDAIGELGAGAADVYAPIEADARRRMSYGV